MQIDENLERDFLFANFNQDSTCCALGTQKGFRIFNCDPWTESHTQEFQSNGGIGKVEMLFRCNILALVGGGKNPRWTKNKVNIWDDNQKKCIGELSFRNDVKAVKLRRDCVIVVLETKVYVYNFIDLKLRDHIETFPNPDGLCAISYISGNYVLACPSLQKGHVLVQRYDAQQSYIIPAHDSCLANIALSFEGHRLVTASEKGTIIRVFNINTQNLVHQFRRGADSTKIHHLSFDSEAQWILCTSEKGTIHIFRLEEGQNPKSSLSFVSALLPAYFSSEWSFAHLHIGQFPSIATFLKDHSILILTSTGLIIKAQFNPKTPGQECIVLHRELFFNDVAE
jgi:WD40 repeat protein